MDIWLGQLLAVTLVAVAVVAWFAQLQQRPRRRAEFDGPDDFPDLSAGRTAGSGRSGRALSDDRHEGDVSDSGGGDGGGGD